MSEEQKTLGPYRCWNCRREFYPGDKCFQFFSTEFTADMYPMQPGYGINDDADNLLEAEQLDDWFRLVYYCSDECVLEDFQKRVKKAVNDGTKN